MNTDFETEAELALQSLPIGLLIMTKGQATSFDKLGKTWLVSDPGTGGITLANGNDAVEQPSASTKAELGHTHPYVLKAGDTMSGALKISQSSDASLQLISTGSELHFINQASSGNLIFAMRDVGGANSHDTITATRNGGIGLYYSGSPKLNTTATGVTITGNALRSGAGGYTSHVNPGNTGGSITVTTTAPTAGAGLPGDIWLVI